VAIRNKATGQMLSYEPPRRDPVPVTKPLWSFKGSRGQ
jgi:hypothetical protein